MSESEFKVGSIMEAPGFKGTLVGYLEAGAAIIDAEVSGIVETHIADSDELAIVLSGRVRLILRDEERVYTAGEFAIVPKGTEHGVVAEVPSRLLLLGAL